MTSSTSLSRVRSLSINIYIYQMVWINVQTECQFVPVSLSLSLSLYICMYMCASACACVCVCMNTHAHAHTRTHTPRVVHFFLISFLLTPKCLHDPRREWTISLVNTWTNTRTNYRLNLHTQECLQGLDDFIAKGLCRNIKLQVLVLVWLAVVSTSISLVQLDIAARSLQSKDFSP